MKYIRNGLLICAAALLIGCFDNTASQQVVTDSKPSPPETAYEYQGCSDAWYEQVESQVITDDGAGHGPDLGSDEWRSVVEFKLGIRGDTVLADLTGDDWCRYIDEQYIQVHD